MQPFRYQAVAHWLNDRAQETPNGQLIMVLPSISVAPSVEEFCNVVQSYDLDFKKDGPHSGKWSNGARLTFYNSGHPETLRGPEAHYSAVLYGVVMDPSIRENILICTRLGDNPEVLFS